MTRPPAQRDGGGQPGSVGAWLREHRTLGLLLAVLVVLGVGGIGRLLLDGSDDATSLGVAYRPTASPSGSTATPTGTSIPGVTAGTDAAGEGDLGDGSPAGTTGRDPFGGLPGGSSGSSGGSGTGAAATGATTGSAVTGTGVVQHTATITVTTSIGGLYLGLYSWTSDGRPSFRLNDRTMTPSPGGTFAPSLVYKGKFANKELTCANITYNGAAASLCEGDVLRLA